jgi:hypothetical protein
MASIFTGLAFMHGHIVDRELIFRLGRDEVPTDRGTGAAQATPASTGKERRVVARETPAVPVRPACATC